MLLSDVEARAQRRRTRTRTEWKQELFDQTWRRAKEAGSPAEARRWMDRAHRLAPDEPVVAVALATALLNTGEREAAEALFRSVAATHGAVEAWIGLATCAHAAGNLVLLREATAAALQRSVLTPVLQRLAALAAPGGTWCGMAQGGRLVAGVPLTMLRLDGTGIALPPDCMAPTLPEGWRQAARLDVEAASGPLLGSPIPLAAFAGVEGFVAADGPGVSGWAWCRADPDGLPLLRAVGPLGQRIVTPSLAAAELDIGHPFARPRRFALGEAELRSLGTPVALLGPDGRHLLGSPLDPAAATDGHAIWAETAGPAAEQECAIPRPVDVVIPVYRGFDETMACLQSVLAAVPRGTKVIVVDDASPDAALVAALKRFARARRIVLLRQPENRGFPAAANAGLRAAAGRDAVLLNSDTLVSPSWLERLQAAAYSAPAIGTVTPFTNDGTILSYPDPGGGNPMPDQAGTDATDRLAQLANAGMVADIPVGVGFCLYLRRACLDQLDPAGQGPLREDLFAQGYGEENDLCLRARHAGWRNVAALGVFVAHRGGTSFGNARAHLGQRNGAILERLHPGYNAMVARHQAADPLGPARFRMDARRWGAGRQGIGRQKAGAVLFVTHGSGGGVTHLVQQRAAAVEAAGQRAILLRPAAAAAVLLADGAGDYPNLVFAMPAGLGALTRFLRADRPSRVELHHMLGHHHTIASLPARLRVPATSVLHDYARFCPRIALVSTGRRYCGEPDLDGCEACIADLGSLLEDDPPIPVLLARSNAELLGAAQVVAPSMDAAARLARHFPGTAPAVEPWEDDAAWPPIAPPPQRGGLCVAVVGAIGIEKGYDVLLACVRDARARDLPVRFVVIGYTADDERMMAAGPVFVTGEYQDAEGPALIREHGAQLALIPSVFPETWCFALSRAWQAGLPAVVFDLGAQAERVRATGRGWVLPLGLSPRGLNDALLRLAPRPPSSHSPPR